LIRRICGGNLFKRVAVSLHPHVGKGTNYDFTDDESKGCGSKNTGKIFALPEDKKMISLRGGKRRRFITRDYSIIKTKTQNI